MSSTSTPTPATAESVPAPKVWLINANHQYLSQKCPLSFRQIQLYFLYDMEVRSGRAGQAAPAGYANFASNYYTEGRLEAFAWVNSDGVTMGTDRKSVDPDIFEVDMASCFTVKDFKSLLPDGAKVLTPEQAELFDRMLLLSASPTLCNREGFCGVEMVFLAPKCRPDVISRGYDDLAPATNKQHPLKDLAPTTDTHIR
ncbi:hypothetical protein B0H13DRAFT_2306709 [Mycena leptocephala]|nr:hypothetical protein B0H13DRAFT_2306709 [Mycena leptocephala]